MVSKISEQRKFFLLENAITKKLDHKMLYSEYLQLSYEDYITWGLGSALITEKGLRFLEETLMNSTT